jgi:hypothetical protein
MCVWLVRSRSGSCSIVALLSLVQAIPDQSMLDAMMHRHASAFQILDLSAQQLNIWPEGDDIGRKLRKPSFQDVFACWNETHDDDICDWFVQGEGAALTVNSTLRVTNEHLSSTCRA